MNKTILTLLMLLSFPTASQAHVKWFVTEPFALHRYGLSDPAVLTWMAIVAVLALIAVLLDRSLFKTATSSECVHYRIYRLFLVLIGASLLATSYMGSVLAAHYTANTQYMMNLQVIQAGIGVLFIFNVQAKASSIVLVLIYLFVGIKVGPIEILDYLNVLGIAAFVYCYNSRDLLRQYALPMLRVLTGAGLVVLALSEKLLNPELATAFLADHQWNFMLNLGLNQYSNALFILSVGFMELLFGVLFILGVVTRINTAVISGFLLTSNMTFFLQDELQMALVEIIGHLPLIAAAIVMVIYGAGTKLRLNPISDVKNNTCLTSVNG
ncbi:MAG: hypothetical protein HN790_04925 [Methylococcales bacterium]|jgi:uncharacterized membrane protein YphA (DoxX/SURF4 family)|nr:hypothetical protein [Methylococcales bacterium]